MFVMRLVEAGKVAWEGAGNAMVGQGGVLGLWLEVRIVTRRARHLPNEAFRPG